VPKRKRVQREHTEDWQTIQQYTLWPEQTAYELLRPIVLFGDPATQREKETGEPRPTLERKADAFDEQGMVSLFASRPRKQPQETARSLPPDMRQLIVDLRVELPTMSLREIAEICEARFQRCPSHNSVKMVLASGPPPSINTRRYQTWDQIPDPAERRHAVVQLHAEGWSITSIAEYLGLCKEFSKFHITYIMRRLADYYLNKAPTLDEMKKAHRKFIRDYNCQIHFAHRERQDGRHSPQDVLRGVLARTLPAPTLARIFFATEFTRHLDRSGYIRFRRWRFYAEEGLARQQVQISIYTSTLKIEYQDTELAFYTMEWAEDNKHIKEVKNPRLIETGYQLPQLKLWMLGPDEWLLFLKLPDYAARKKPKGAPDVIQLPLLDPDENQRQEVSS
jgi:hypothetical protein